MYSFFQSAVPWPVLIFFPPFIFISWRLITLQYCSGFCHPLTWISHGFTCVPHPNTHLPPPSPSHSQFCFFLKCIQVSQEAGQMVWYSHLSKYFPQFIVIHIVKCFGIVNKAEIDVFLELSCFLMIQRMLAIWSLIPLLFLKPAWTSGSSWFTYCWSLAWRILSIALLMCEMSAIVW